MHLNEETVFNEALDITDPNARAEFLDQACSGNDELRRQVEWLLEAYPKGDALEPTSDGTPITDSEPGSVREKVGDTIGPYKLLEQLGEGGMGMVYMAEQTKPVSRKVALKIIKVGMDTGQVVARFEAERQALALMNHPNIAKVLDAGETDTGRPYFAMELVRGIPITEFCDQQKLDLRQRLELFSDICEAVQHAHQKGIIHRDLKPSNLLVELHDVKAVPKIIDFGIAKATNQKLTERTLFTQFSQMIGTPMYMSPEQAHLSGLDIDTRTDIYSLGVLLYELLTGSTPVTREALSKVGYDELRRMIQEDEPPLPSARISTLKAEALSTLATNRHVSSHLVHNQVRGDLDWIVVKSLEKDRTRRYQSALEFADDIGRFLTGDPVEAHPPSVAYRTKKLVRRYKTPLAVAATVLLMLMATTAISVRYAIVADAATRRAEQRRQEAEENFQQARQTVDTYLTQVSENILLKNPSMDPLRKELLELALQYYEQFIEQRSDDPALQFDLASAYYRVGSIRSSLGDQPGATEAHQKAFDIREVGLAADPENEDLRHSLVLSYLGLEQAKTRKTYSDWISFMQEAVTVASPLLKPEHRKTLALAYHRLGWVNNEAYREKGEARHRDEALVAWENARSVLEVVVSEGSTDPSIRLALATIYQRTPDTVDKAVKLLEDLAAEMPTDRDIQNQLASAYVNVDYYRKNRGAIEGVFDPASLEKSLGIFQRLAQENPAVLRYRRNSAEIFRRLGERYRDAGQQDAAVDAHQASLDIYAQMIEDFPDNKARHTDLANAFCELGKSQYAAGETEKAIHQFQKAIAILTETGKGKSTLAESYNYLALAQHEAGKFDEAIESSKAILDIGKQLVDSSPNQLRYRIAWLGNYANLGLNLREAGRPEEALDAFQDGVEVYFERRFLESDPPDSVLVLREKLSDLGEQISKSMDALSDGDDGKAEQLLTEQLSRWNGLPEQNESRILQLQTHLRLANLFEKSARVNEAANHFRDARMHFDRLAAENGMIVEALAACLELCPSLQLVRADREPEKEKFFQAVSASSNAGLIKARDAAKTLGDQASYLRWCQVAQLYYRPRNWVGAEEEARRAIEWASDQPPRLNAIAPFFLLAGKEDEYAQLCEDLMNHWEEWDSSNLAQAAALCSLHPISPSDPDRLLRLANRAVAEGPNWSNLGLARVHYRVGDYEHAISGLEEWLESHPAMPPFDLAIAHHLARNEDEARVWFEKALRANETSTARAGVRLKNEVLRQQAELLILGRIATGEQSVQPSKDVEDGPRVD